MERSDEKRRAHRDWNHNYKVRQRQQGVPDRRTVADAVLIEVMTAANRQDPAVRPFLASAGKRLLSIRQRNGKPKYTRCGILKRWNEICRMIRAASV